jgi:hypothetical protein
MELMINYFSGKKLCCSGIYLGFKEYIKEFRNIPAKLRNIPLQ